MSEAGQNKSTCTKKQASGLSQLVVKVATLLKSTLAFQHAKLTSSPGLRAAMRMRSRQDRMTVEPWDKQAKHRSRNGNKPSHHATATAEVEQPSCGSPSRVDGIGSITPRSLSTVTTNSKLLHTAGPALCMHFRLSHAKLI